MFKVGEKIVLIKPPTKDSFYRTITNQLQVGEIVTVSISNRDSYGFEEFGGMWGNVEKNFVSLDYYREEKLKRILK